MCVCVCVSLYLELHFVLLATRSLCYAPWLPLLTCLQIGFPPAQFLSPFHCVLSPPPLRPSSATPLPHFLVRCSRCHCCHPWDGRAEVARSFKITLSRKLSKQAQAKASLLPCLPVYIDPASAYHTFSIWKWESEQKKKTRTQFDYGFCRWRLISFSEASRPRSNADWCGSYPPNGASSNFIKGQTRSQRRCRRSSRGREWETKIFAKKSDEN